MAESHNRVMTIAAWLLILFMPSTALGYGAGVEQYIPIGQSPGVSGRLSREGVVRSVRETKGVLMIQLDTRGLRHPLIVDKRRTAVYLDWTRCQRSNQRGTWRDILAGTYVEVYSVKWVKVRQC